MQKDRHDVVFSFTGKSGKDWDITIEDDHLVDLILKTNRLGAKDADLFMYISEAGNEVDLKAEHINQYIRASPVWASPPKISARGRRRPVVLERLGVFVFEANGRRDEKMAEVHSIGGVHGQVMVRRRLGSSHDRHRPQQGHVGRHRYRGCQSWQHPNCLPFLLYPPVVPRRVDRRAIG